MKRTSKAHVAGGRNRAYAFCTGRWDWITGYAAPYTIITQRKVGYGGYPIFG